MIQQRARIDVSNGVNFGQLGIKVKGEQVSTSAGVLRARELGPLIGSCAGVVGKSRMTGPRLVTSIAVGTPANTPVTTFVQFPDGSRYERKSYDERQARKEAAQFNAYSDAAMLASEAGSPFKAAGLRQCRRCEFAAKNLRDLAAHNRAEHPSAVTQAADQRRRSR